MCAVLVGVLIKVSNDKNVIKTITEQKVIAAKYEDGFIAIEVEDSNSGYSSIERYEHRLVDIGYIDDEAYIIKGFNGYGKLIDIKLLYYKSVF